MIATAASFESMLRADLRPSRKRRADVDHTLVLDGHEGGADADDHRLGVGEELLGDRPRLFCGRDLDADLADRPRVEPSLAELAQQTVAIRNPCRFDLD